MHRRWKKTEEGIDKTLWKFRGIRNYYRLEEILEEEIN